MHRTKYPVIGRIFLLTSGASLFQRCHDRSLFEFDDQRSQNYWLAQLNRATGAAVALNVCCKLELKL